MSITYHVCKYTPTELLTALGGQCALLDEAPENFDLSDQVAHPNLCGFGKSVIQAALAGQVKELVLVNCCDSIRRCYDVLRAQGGVSLGAVLLCMLLLMVGGSAFTLLLGPDLQALLTALAG